jgi:hypothetical protein
MAEAVADVFGAGRVAHVGANDGVRRSIPWQRAHEELLRLAKKRAGLDFEEGRWLLSALRSGTHVRLGYGWFHEYTERLFGYGPKLTQEKLRVAEALEELPETGRELEAGTISFSAARELTRVAVPATEREWLDVSRGRTVREIEQLVSGHRPGSRPDDIPDPAARRHVIRLEVSGEALATFREAMAKVRRDAGGPLDDDAAILLLARTVLEGPRDEGRASYQVALTICEDCRRARQDGRGESLDVAPEVVEMALCDGHHIGHVDVELSVHVGAGDDAHVDARRPTRRRATQSIPPALRRAVLRRDGHLCQAPGCRHAIFVDVHHIVPRSDDGKHTADNLLTLCSAHHRAMHRGRLLVRGTPSAGLAFFHADGTLYGGSPSPAAADAHAKAFRALTQMGFSETQAKHALAELPRNPSATLEQIIRQALKVLTPKSR